MKEKIHLWLDDVRDPTQAPIKRYFGARGDEVWVKTVQEAIIYLEQGNVESISFDHDLGTDLLSGYDLAKYIEEKAFIGDILPLSYRVHSQNPVGRKDIHRAMDKAQEYWDSWQQAAHFDTSLENEKQERD